MSSHNIDIRLGTTYFGKGAAEASRDLKADKEAAQIAATFDGEEASQ